MNITDLKCEYSTNPIGLDITRPQFSWQIRSEERGIRQTAYQLLIAGSPEDLVYGKELIWDSGKIYSQRSAGILYKGPALESRRCYYWLIRVWDSYHLVSESTEPAFFEMGLLNQSDWQATWIGCPASWTGRVVYFRKAFTLDEPVKRARAYISGLGYYVLYLNGTRVGDHVLDPGTSDYNKRVLYATYDIGRFLKEKNALGVMVGPGWYGVPKLWLQLEVIYENDRTETLATCWDPFKSWFVSVGPTLSSSIFDGEIYDAREERPGWAMPDGPLESKERTRQWINAVVTDDPGGKMVSQIQEPIKVVETIVPILIGQPFRNVFVFDAGRNLAGWAAIKVKGERGAKINLKFAESLNPDGTVNQENLRSARAEDTYILKGEGLEEWEPSFTYHGFRYLQMEGLSYEPGGDDLRIKVVRSAVSQSGKFKCSNELLNRINQMVYFSEASNLHSIPTDCPQRDERMGWLNDMTVRIEQALYNFNLSRFYLKWIEDVKDTQGSDGTITDTAPFRWGFRPADPVSASFLLAAIKSYTFYGNERIIFQHYKGLKAWVNYLRSRTEDGIVNYSYWGDWSPPEEFGTPGSVGSGAVSRFTPGTLISTGYLYYCAGIIAQMASIIGNVEDEKFYRNVSKETAAAFNSVWWNEETGGYGSNNQACNSFALFLRLVEENNISRVVNNLVENVKRHDYHLTTGNLCTKYLLETLTEYGHAEVAYKITTRESYPSWGYMVASGATTLWERWENKTGGEMNSHNHPMMGSVGSWFYKYLMGILPDVERAGFEKFTVKPFIPMDLKFVEGEYNSIKGVIKVAWRKESGSLYFNLTIPPNSTATVYIPAKGKNKVSEGNQAIDKIKELTFLGVEGEYVICELLSGTYHFKSDL